MVYSHDGRTNMEDGLLNEPFDAHEYSQIIAIRRYSQDVRASV